MEKHQGTYLSLSHMEVCKATAGVSPPWHCCAYNNFPLTLCCAQRQQSLPGALGTPVLQSQLVCQPGLWVASPGRLAGARSWQGSALTLSLWKQPMASPCILGSHREMLMHLTLGCFFTAANPSM